MAATTTDRAQWSVKLELDDFRGLVLFPAQVWTSFGIPSDFGMGVIPNSALSVDATPSRAQSHAH